MSHNNSTIAAVALGEQPGATGPVLVLNAITKRFGGVLAIDGVSLELAPGERMAVIGPNGAGKTTLFKIIAGDIRPTTGSVHLFGQDVTKVPTFRRARSGVARTFQVSNLLSGLSVLDNVRVAAQAGTRVSRIFWWLQRAGDDIHESALRILENVGLSSRTNDIAGDLSHGEQRQLEIAMALAKKPSLLLLDEPAAGLSPAERVTLRRLIEELPRDLPLLLIEHDMSIALELSDRVFCMDNGRPVVMGTPQEVRDNQTVRSIYLGRSAT